MSNYSYDDFDQGDHYGGDDQPPTPYERIAAFWHKHKMLIVVGGGLSIAVLWFVIEVWKGLPTIEQLENPKPEVATRILSADGIPLDNFYIKNRTTVRLKDVPKFFIDALIATEDRDFYDHWGLDLTGMFRAILKDITTLSPRQGASTITQQLVRNLYLSQEKTMFRKVREAISAVQIERSHTKNEILEMYLNVCYMGRGAYGIAVASQIYFGKDASKLTPSECAFFVGILKGPENYDPEDNYDRALARRNLVLDNMVDAGYLNDEKCRKIKQEPLRVQPQKGYVGIAPHFVEMIRQELSKKPELAGYDLYRDGLVVYSTLNAKMQMAANRAVDEHLAIVQRDYVDKVWNWQRRQGLLDTLLMQAVKNHPAYKYAESDEEKKEINKRLRSTTSFVDSVKKAATTVQCGFVCLDPATGYILAMVGGANTSAHRYGLNHVTQIIRQPGSSFKPFIYASVFEKGYTPESIVSNEPIEMQDGDKIWRPRNSSGNYGGSMPIRTAIQFSVNLCAIHALLEMTNARDVVALAKRMGIRSNLQGTPSLALGTYDVNPLDLVSAYSIFSNNGTKVTPIGILRVEDRHGKVLYRAHPTNEPVLDVKTVQMMTDCLSRVVDGGTASSIRQWFNLPAAGKTGTTNNYADAWFVGYTPHYCAGVWVGFDDKRVTFTSANGQGGRAAAPIWGRFMKYAYAAMKPKIAYFNYDYRGDLRLPPDSTSTDSSAIKSEVPVPAQQ